MIRKFKHRGLERFFTNGDYRGIPAQFSNRLERMLDRLEAALKPEDMNLPGFKFHPLKGERKGYFSISVSGNWRLTFRFEQEDAIDINLEDYH